MAPHIKVMLLLAPDFSGLPPTLIITTEYDPLRDEREGLWQASLGSRVPATISRYDGAIHGFVGLLELGDRALRETAVALTQVFAAQKAGE